MGIKSRKKRERRDSSAKRNHSDQRTFLGPRAPLTVEGGYAVIQDVLLVGFDVGVHIREVRGAQVQRLVHVGTGPAVLNEGSKDFKLDEIVRIEPLSEKS